MSNINNHSTTQAHELNRACQQFDPDIAVNILSVRVKEWDEIIEKGPAGVSLNFLDKYCANVVDVVKELEPKLSSATLSCDINHSQRPNDIRVDNIKVELAVLSSEMEKVFSSKTWFPSLKNTLESDGKTTIQKEISQPGTTTDKEETSLGLPSIIRISELENLEANYTGNIKN
ncbi:unnamed protein product [Schistosoma bovis]|nr:unnamed protein product [Schistosoma bovis]